jgi:hypothetical protein
VAEKGHSKRSFPNLAFLIFSFPNCAAEKGHLEVVQYLTLEQHCDPLHVYMWPRITTLLFT